MSFSSQNQSDLSLSPTFAEQISLPYASRCDAIMYLNVIEWEKCVPNIS